MDFFSKGIETQEKNIPVKRDGWVELPQQMGKVRLTSEYRVATENPSEASKDSSQPLIDQRSTLHHLFLCLGQQKTQQAETEKKAATAEECKDQQAELNDDPDNDDPMTGSECGDQVTAKVPSAAKDSIDYASLPSIEQLLEQNGFGAKFGQASIQQ